jgi:hypothetical protein
VRSDHAALADLLVALHFLFVLFVAFGAVLALRWPRVAWLHVPAAVWGAFVELTGRICPLTPLENELRELGGGAGYQGTFIEHYLVPVLYPPGLTTRLQTALGVGVIAINVAVYALICKRRAS